MTNHLKDIVTGVAHVAHDLKENITHVVHDIAKAVHSLGTNIENSLKEKGLTEINRETFSGRDTHNIIANAAGEIDTNNDSELTRGLFNHVLFTEGGELRLSNMASNSPEDDLLKMVKNPGTGIHPSQSSKFITTSEKNEHE